VHTPSDIILQKNPPVLANADFESSIIGDSKLYKKELKKWQQKVVEAQQAYYHQNRRAVIVLQGWDASGKGGAIRRLTEKLDPRGYAVHPIGAPTAEELQQHYLHRFQMRLPASGKIAIFDRSWYGRVLVERVEGFASAQAWQRAYQEINEFERTLMDDGVRIVKLFLHITPEEQLTRFDERLNNPSKQWKLTSEDIRNRAKWDEYVEAINDMFRYTSTEATPWQLIAANRKWFTRIAVLKHVYHVLAEGVNLTPPPLDKELIKEAKKKLGLVYND
jgi:AMP-polyphosphate phosphotransferase